MPQIVEIKARCVDQAKIRQLLMERNARSVGTDHQVDTYFKVPNGRLKLREGKIENNLIHYDRPNQSGPKTSMVNFYKSKPDSTLKVVLETALGVLTVVDKQREIYFVDNIKFHLDTVKTLGTFVEIEAIDDDMTMTLEFLDLQCREYIALFEIKEEDLIDHSYSDMVLTNG